MERGAHWVDLKRWMDIAEGPDFGQPRPGRGNAAQCRQGLERKIVGTGARLSGPPPVEPERTLFRLSNICARSAAEACAMGNYRQGDRAGRYSMFNRALLLLWAHGRRRGGDRACLCLAPFRDATGAEIHRVPVPERSRSRQAAAIAVIDDRNRGQPVRRLRGR